MRSTPFTPVVEALERLEGAVSPLVGIVREIAPAMWAPDEPRLHSFSCELASSLRTTGCATPERAGSAHVDAARARAASIGEALERYAATFVPEGLVVACARDLDDEAVAPEAFALFHERQFVPGYPIVRFSETTRISWVTGFSLVEEGKRLRRDRLVLEVPCARDDEALRDERGGVPLDRLPDRCGPRAGRVDVRRPRPLGGRAARRPERAGELARERVQTRLVRRPHGGRDLSHDPDQRRDGVLESFERLNDRCERRAAHRSSRAP